jgi:hypothetical protein
VRTTVAGGEPSLDEPVGWDQRKMAVDLLRRRNPDDQHPALDPRKPVTLLSWRHGRRMVRIRLGAGVREQLPPVADEMNSLDLVTSDVRYIPSMS